MNYKWATVEPFYELDWENGEPIGGYVSVSTTFPPNNINRGYRVLGFYCWDRSTTNNPLCICESKKNQRSGGMSCKCTHKMYQNLI